MSNTGEKWVGKSVRRFEDLRLITGRGAFINDLTPVANMHHAAVLRSPHAHARIKGIDCREALKLPGVFGVLTGDDVKKMAKPFQVGVSRPPKYYPLAVDKARYFGEPVAVVVAVDRYVAEDALDLIKVDYEPLPAVVDVEKALEPGAPILHDELGDNVAVHRNLVYGDVAAAFAAADLTVKARFSFPKYGSTPMETYGVIAQWDPHAGMMTVWSNFHGPFILHPLVATMLQIPENKLRFIVPGDIGGGFGIKTSIYPYIALIALAAKKLGCAVKWIEDRQEHLSAGSSGTDRISYIEAAVKRDGTILGLKTKIIDNVGGYIRAPEPADLFRTTGNYLGAYTIGAVDIDAWAVHTNKSPTGPNRGYGCQQLYFTLERTVDLIAEKLGMDPSEVRFKNLIRPEQFPYLTPTGGLYDSGDYPEALRKALAMAKYEELRREQEKARAAGKLFGIGMVTAVDPSVSNMGYVTVAIEKAIRQSPSYLPKSGALETATLTMDPLGRVSISTNHCPQGQGHETVVAQIVADELGIRPDEVNVITEFDTATRVWSIASGSYSSRFASVGASAIAGVARQAKEKIMKIAGFLLKVDPERLELRNGMAVCLDDPSKTVSLKRVAGTAHWNPLSLPEDIGPGISATYTFSFPTAKMPDEEDHINSSQTYGFIADVMAVEIDPETGKVKIVKYVSVHDVGNILNPMIVEGQVVGSAMHGIGGALYEEMAYDDDGQYLAGTFADYLCPTAMEAVKMEIGHVISPSPVTALGSKGAGESCSMTAPAVIGNAVADALKPLGALVDQLPLTPDRVWRLINRKGASA